jgi:hypothetical protein
VATLLVGESGRVSAFFLFAAFFASLLALFSAAGHPTSGETGGDSGE